MVRVFIVAAAFAALLASTAAAAPAPDGETTAEAPAGPASPLVVYGVAAKPPSFAVTSLLSLEFGSLNSPSALAHGNDIVESFHIGDPARVVAAAIAKDVADRLGKGGGAVVEIAGQPGSGEPGPSQGRYVVLAKTEQWGFDFFTFDPGHYRAIYSASVSVRDTQANKRIAQAGCYVFGRNPAGAPTGKELLADDGARLKALLAEQTAACVSLLETRVLPKL